MSYEPKYWNNEGKYQKEYNILWNKYVPDMGTTPLINVDKARKMGYSDKRIRKAQLAIIDLIEASNRYYNLFNNGVPFVLNGLHTLKNPESWRRLDRAFDKIVKRAWELTDHAKMPSLKDV